MIVSRFGMPTAAVAGLLLLCAMPGLSQAPRTSPVTSPTPRMDGPRARQHEGSRPKDIFDGLALTDEEKVKIDKIHKDTRSRITLVEKDAKLSGDQKEAMTNGILHLERNQIFEILTQEQKEAVLKKYRAGHPAGKPATGPQPGPAAHPK